MQRNSAIFNTHLGNATLEDETRNRRRRLTSFAPPTIVPSTILEMPYGANYGTTRTATTTSTAIATATSTEAPVERQPRPKPGILRLDMKKPRRSSGCSMEFRAPPQMPGEGGTPPVSPSPPQQLSVRWAKECEFNKRDLKCAPPMHSNSVEVAVGEKRKGSLFRDEKLYELSSSLGSPVEEIDCSTTSLQQPTPLGANDDHGNQQQDEDEDYSISVSAIMQRRASIRGYRNKRGSRVSRRASSPMAHVLENAEWRRSSVYTSSSEEGTNQESTQEQICENIRLHKEVIQSVKLQPWPIRKKLKLVRQAKTYVARHEGALQERFAMSRSTKDLWARFKILMAARWRHWKRETSSFLAVLIPWELRIKEIESHFGSGVASYFTFLRWLMWVNIMIAIPLVAFVIGPEYFATKHDETDPRKRMTDREYQVAGNLFTIWEFEGYLKYSPIFYGYYSSFSGASSLGYKLPLAYFLTTVVVYIYSFVATLRKMAENSRNSKLSSKDDECTFSWKLFTGWDFMIGHAETAHNRIASVVVGFKEVLVEEAEKKKDNRNWRIILQRILVNILVMGLLAASGYTIVALVNNAENFARYDNWLSRNAVNVTISLLSFFLPMIFEALGLFENCHPRQQLRLQLARIMILNMLNLYALMFSLIYKINSKEKPLQQLKIINETATRQYAELTAIIESLKLATTTSSYQDSLSTALDENVSSSILTTTTDATTSVPATESLLKITAAAIYTTVTRIKCYNITVRCSKPTRINHRNLSTMTALLLLNLTTTANHPTTTTEVLSTAKTATLMPQTMIPATIIPAIIMPATKTTEPAAPRTTIPTTKISVEMDPATMYPTVNMSSETATIAYSPPPTAVATTATTTDATTATTTDATTARTQEFPTIPKANNNLQTTARTATSTTFPPATTTIDFETTYDEYLSSLHPTGSTSIQSSTASTSTELPGNDSFFEYYDYFAGLPIDLGDIDDVGVASRNGEEANQPQQNIVKRSVRAAGESSVTDKNPVPKTSKYNALRRTEDGLYEKEDYNDFTSTTQTIFTSTHAEHDIAEATTITTAASTDNFESTNEQLKQVVAYFTTSTATPSSAPTTRQITTTTPSVTTQQSTTDLESEERTPFFIDEDIGETAFIDANALDEDNFEFCIRQVCEPADIFTTTAETEPATMEPITEVATPAPSPLEVNQRRLNEVKLTLKSVQRNLTTMCWETSLGQELSKVIVFDGVTLIVATLCIDFLRALFVRYVNRSWCWDMEKTFPQYGDFKIAENILSLIHNQGQVWMGIFFSPGLVIINLLKLVIMMYFRSWIVLTCNVPHEVVFKASKSNNFYLALLLMMLFLSVLPVGYAIVWLRPSWHCGPFSDYNRISEFITNTTRNALPKQLHEPLDYMTSSSTVIPLLLLLILIIYYLVSLTGALREANQDLRTQLQKEREEERKKMFRVPETKPAEPNSVTLTNRWRKVLEASSPVTPTQPPDFETDEYKKQARKEFMSRIVKEALRKSSATSEDESVAFRHGRDDEDTDTEHQESLPRDEEAKEHVFGLSRLQQIRRTRKPSLIDIVQIAKGERDRLAYTPPALTGTVNKSRFEVERVENESPLAASTTDDHDPEINSRIVRERRESLLRRKDEEKQRNKIERSDVTERPPVLKHQPVERSHFKVVDEKSPPSYESPETESKFKLRRSRLKEIKLHVNATAEPEVFTFEQKTPVKRGNSNKKCLLDEKTSAKDHEERAAEKSDELSTTPSPTQKHHPNAEMLLNLSRQGRRKIGSLLALMREAVNTMKSDSDSPTSPNETAESTSSNNNGKSQRETEQGATTTPPASMTAILMPPTPELDTLMSQPKFGEKISATAGAAVTPRTPKLAEPEDLEELDEHGPIPFPVRSFSQRHKPAPMRQDSQTSVWSDNIPTITISLTGSQECISESEAAASTAIRTPHAEEEAKSIEIQIEDEQQNNV